VNSKRARSWSVVLWLSLPACSSLLGANFDGLTLAADAGTSRENGAKADSPNACRENEKACPSGCVSKNDPAFGCGASARCEPCSVAHGKATCNAAGACAVGSCDPGRANCTHNEEDCTTKVTSDPEHCGGCDKRCDTTQVCGPTGCVSSCSEGLTRCERSCVNIAVDADHCGACDKRCPATQHGVATCNESTCGIACNAGYAPCAEGCCATQCGPATCPTGCCANGRCERGSAVTACGKGGAACANCEGPEGCSEGICAQPTKSLLLYGGVARDGAGNFSDTHDAWTWDGVRWKHVTSPAGDGLELSGVALATANREVLLTIARGATRIWNGAAWREPAAGTRPFSLGTMAAIRQDSVVLLDQRATTWIWNVPAETWTKSDAVGPSARNASAMTSLGASALLFGGSGRLAALGDTWTWNGVQWKNVATTGASARSGHAMARLGSRAILFGGTSSVFGVPALTFDDTWEWNPATNTWSQVATTGPAARYGHAMAALGNKVVLFGGHAGDTIFSDTWEWDGTRWTERNVPGPQARYGHGMAGW
jgi:hypothetical protein